MMRPGDKLESYRLLARALERIAHLPWTISVAGDGPCRQEVVAEFARLDPARLEWLGERQAAEMPSIYGNGALYAWPGYGEAYGLAYLEAQAAGLPVVAQDMDGVPGVVRNGETAILTPAGDMAAFADAIATLLGDEPLRRSMSQAARRFVFEERSFEVASARLASILGISGKGGMADDPVWRPLHAELDRWRQAGRVADLWLRDDDAVQPTAALDRLLDLTARHAIPAAVGGHPRACRRTACRAACVGARHRRCGARLGAREPRAGRREEAGARAASCRPTSCSANCRGRKPSSTGCLPGKPRPFSCRPGTGSTAPCCRRSPKQASPRCRCSARRSRPPIAVVNTHVDIIDWHGGRGGKDHGGLVLELAAELRWRREAGSREAVGVLTHHLVHDEIAWLFLERLFEATAGNPACRWASIRDLI